MSNDATVVKQKHNHYYKDVTKFGHVDVYRVLQLFNVTDPCIQHAVKKLLVAGGRGAGKDITKDIQESIDSLVRWQTMRDEEQRVAEVVDQRKEYRVDFIPKIGLSGSYRPGYVMAHAYSEHEALEASFALLQSTGLTFLAGDYDFQITEVESERTIVSSVNYC